MEGEGFVTPGRQGRGLYRHVINWDSTGRRSSGGDDNGISDTRIHHHEHEGNLIWIELPGVDAGQHIAGADGVDAINGDDHVHEVGFVSHESNREGAAKWGNHRICCPFVDDDVGVEGIGAVLVLQRLGLGGEGFPPERIEWVELQLAFDPVADVEALNQLAREVRLGVTAPSQSGAEYTNWFTVERADLLDELGLLVPEPEWHRLRPPT